MLAGFYFVWGWMVACYCPGAFVFAAALCVLPIFVGRQLIRTVAILFFGASLLSASHMYLKEAQSNEKAEQIRIKILRQNKIDAAKPLATGSQRRIVHAA